MDSSSQYKGQLKEVYASYYSRMKRFAQEYVVREEDAENIVQDIFIELWEKQVGFTSFVNLNGFLCLFHPKSIPVFQSKSIPF